jgi:hypothetical protein
MVAGVEAAASRDGSRSFGGSVKLRPYARNVECLTISAKTAGINELDCFHEREANDFVK